MATNDVCIAKLPRFAFFFAIQAVESRKTRVLFYTVLLWSLLLAILIIMYSISRNWGWCCLWAHWLQGMLVAVKALGSDARSCHVAACFYKPISPSHSGTGVFSHYCLLTPFLPSCRWRGGGAYLIGSKARTVCDRHSSPLLANIFGPNGAIIAVGHDAGMKEHTG